LDRGTDSDEFRCPIRTLLGEIEIWTFQRQTTYTRVLVRGTAMFDGDLLSGQDDLCPQGLAILQYDSDGWQPQNESVDYVEDGSELRIR